jgi:hypothetical protein
MKKTIVLLIIMGSLLHMASAQTFPTFKSFRYDEDYSFLKKDSTRDWYKKMKYSPLSKNGNTYLSFGGEVRLQYFTIKHDGWGDAPEDGDGYIQSRFLLHSDFHAGTHFRACVQLQGSMTNGKAMTSAVDEDPLDLHQAFVEANVNLGTKTKAVFRLGRQEMFYGSQRLIGLREGPNNRMSFDGLKTMIINPGYQLDLFYMHSNAVQKGVFDDAFNKDNQTWGGYLTLHKVPALQNIDLYYIGIWRRNMKLDDGAGTELRHSIGTRIWGKQNSLEYDVEGTYQAGDFSGKRIGAYSIAANIAWEFKNITFKPKAGLKTEIMSGDRNHGDNTLQTFDPMFPNGGWYGLASFNPIGPANLIDLHPYIGLQLSPKVYAEVDYDAYWRESTNDGLYAPNVSLIYPSKNSTKKTVGQQLAGEIVYTPNPFLFLRAEIDWFNAGGYLKDVGAGKNMLFTGVTVTLKL